MNQAESKANESHHILNTNKDIFKLIDNKIYDGKINNEANDCTFWWDYKMVATSTTHRSSRCIPPLGKIIIIDKIYA